MPQEKQHSTQFHECQYLKRALGQYWPPFDRWSLSELGQPRPQAAEEATEAAPEAEQSVEAPAEEVAYADTPAEEVEYQPVPSPNEMGEESRIAQPVESFDAGSVETEEASAFSEPAPAESDFEPAPWSPEGEAEEVHEPAQFGSFETTETVEEAVPESGESSTEPETFEYQADEVTEEPAYSFETGDLSESELEETSAASIEEEYSIDAGEAAGFDPVSPDEFSSEAESEFTPEPEPVAETFEPVVESFESQAETVESEPEADFGGVSDSDFVESPDVSGYDTEPVDSTISEEQPQVESATFEEAAPEASAEAEDDSPPVRSRTRFATSSWP